MIKGLFNAAVDLKPEERAAFLDRECNGNTDLRQEVEALLAADAGAGSFLEYPVPHLPIADLFEINAFETTIGPYRLLALIGEGGMGEVWLAEQEEPVRRRVALKLIKAGMETREVIMRFESERQALALMDHPAIAKVFDAGSTRERHPYFVMEYVAGIPISTYCDTHKLTVRQRMELFVLVCEGVQHAHQKAIIHRDLKPSNILVAEVDGKPLPRIIDFGVAKATSQKLTEKTIHTHVGILIGTLGYMSPEQADPAGKDIDTRADIYSLGAVLYELLAGAPPFKFEKLRYDEVLLRLRAQDPLRPSIKLVTLGDEAAHVAINRRCELPTLLRQLRGDPDAIALKALEKDRTHRYASVAELAADVSRYLHNEPVVAHPPSTAYRAHKYIRRHGLGVGIAALGVLMLTGFTVVQSFELRRIAQERDHATRERDRADRIADFMTSMFQIPYPNEGRANTITAREVLDNASNEIGAGLNNDPELKAKMMFAMAQSYTDIGLYSLAQPLAQGALAMQHRILGIEHRDTLSSMRLLATDLRMDGRYHEAEMLIRQTLDVQRRVFGSEDRETLASMDVLAITRGNQGDFAEEEELSRESLDKERRVLGPEHTTTLRTVNRLAAALTSEGQYEKAETLERETLDVQRRVFGSDDMHTVSSMSILGDTLRREGKLAEAERLQRNVLDIERRVLGSENPRILYDLEIEAIYVSLEGRYRNAEDLFHEAIETARKTKEPSQLANAWYAFACGAASTGHRSEALRYLGDAIDHGFSASAWMDTDSDLQSLHNDPRFNALVIKSRQNASARPRSGSHLLP